MPRNFLPGLLLLHILPLCAHAEVADKLPTLHGLWGLAVATGCVFGVAAFGIACWTRWPWLAVATPCLALLVALGPAFEPDIAASAERELGSAYLMHAEDAEWLLPVMASLGLLAGVVARRRRVT